MSFDELPPDSEPPRTGDEQAPVSEQDPSVQDAPPAGSTRRRRATRAGTAAASSTNQAETNSPRTRRTRTKTEPATSTSTAPQADGNTQEPAEPSAPTPEPPGAIVDSPSAAEADSHRRGPEASPPRRSRRAKSVPAAPAEESPAVAAPEAEATPPVRKRSPRNRTSVRAEARTPDESVTDSAASEAFTLPENADLIAEAETQAQAPAAPPTRSRRQRGKRAPEPVEPSSTETPVSESPAGTEETPDAESLAKAPATRTARSRRGRGRGRREESAPDRSESDVPGVADTAVAPVPAPRWIDRTVGAHLIVRNGIPRITINNAVYAPILFFGNMQGSVDKQRVLSEVRRAARAGVHLHSTLVELPCPLSEATEALDEIDRALRAILDADPQGYVMPRIVFVPARGWKREYPTDIATYADGTTGDPSLTSDRFWREAEHSLATLISHLREYEWSNRVFGYHLERGEWFQPAEQGYDRSMANREAFRDWLRAKYNNSLVSLRAAWYDGNVQFHTAEIPPVHNKPNLQRAFFETRRERRTIDFCEFTSESTASRLASLAGTIKRAADDQSLVSVCYGYTFEFGHAFSGHLALGQLLECPDIDLLCGPPSYRDRKPGGAASIPAPVDSPRVHGKLWLSEDDTKTFLAPLQQDPDDFNPRLTNRFETEQAYARAMGRAYATHTGIGFMDLWGEGWLDDDGLWERIAVFAERYARILEGADNGRKPDVVVLMDEKSLLHVQRGEPFFRKVTAGIRDLMQRSGVAYEVCLQSDVLKPGFDSDAKLYLFVDPYRLTSEQRTAIAEKLQGGGRTLGWLFAPGACEERPQVGGAMEESAAGAIGITLRQQEWNSEIGSRIVEQRHPITERLNSREIGVRERLNPSFYVDDPDATVLAEYQGSGLPSIAVKRCLGWQSVFIGEPTLTWELLRGICKFAGVHLWTGGEDVAFIGNGWITIHATRDGHRAIRLPGPSALYDLTERRLLGEEVREHRFFLKAGSTHTFRAGSIVDFQALGLPNLVRAEDAPPVHAPVRLPESEPQVRQSVPEPDRRIALSEDMQTLQAVLSMDLTQVEDLPIEELTGGQAVAAAPSYADPAEAEARLAALLPEADMGVPGRRRRRRGGRGRGRRKAEGAEGDAATPSADAADIDAAGNGAVQVLSVGEPVFVSEDEVSAISASDSSAILAPVGFVEDGTEGGL